MFQIHEVTGFKIGQSQDEIGGSGCSVILCEKGACGGVDVRGGAPATRETDLLNSVNMVDKIHAVMLSGGSAYGLDAASGAMRYLEEKGIGHDMGVAVVPIVCGASLFDLSVGDPKCRPDKEMGYQACLQSGGVVKEGNYGAGTGASIGKILGFDKAMKSGIGTAAMKLGELEIAAIVAVNACGDIFDNDGVQIGGPCIDKTIVSSKQALLNSIQMPQGNTTIGCVITNASLTKAQANKIASIAHNGYARAIDPVHTMSDGDSIFVMGSGYVKGDVNIIGTLAADLIQDAIISAFKHAQSAYGLMSWQEIQQH